MLSTVWATCLKASAHVPGAVISPEFPMLQLSFVHRAGLMMLRCYRSVVGGGGGWGEGGDLVDSVPTGTPCLQGVCMLVVTLQPPASL